VGGGGQVFFSALFRLILSLFKYAEKFINVMMCATLKNTHAEESSLWVVVASL
jgi:hypothetical protein